MTINSLKRNFKTFSTATLLALATTHCRPPAPPVAPQEAQKAKGGFDILQSAFQASQETSAPGAIEADDTTFTEEVKGAKGFVLVEFYADWCENCKKMDIDDIAQREAGKVKVVKMAIERSVKTAKTCGIVEEDRVALPTLLLFKDGDMVLEIDTAQPRLRMIGTLNAVVDMFNKIDAAKTAKPAGPNLL
jgi:thioredoxin 1